MMRKLAHQLIDVGYRALALRLHPDMAGGSSEAMARLIRVRDLLRERSPGPVVHQSSRGPLRRRRI